MTPLIYLYLRRFRYQVSLDLRLHRQSECPQHLGLARASWPPGWIPHGSKRKERGDKSPVNMSKIRVITYYIYIYYIYYIYIYRYYMYYISIYIYMYMSNGYHGNIMIYLWMKYEDLIDLDTYPNMKWAGWSNIANFNGEPKHIYILHVFDDLFLSIKQSFLRDSTPFGCSEKRRDALRQGTPSLAPSKSSRTNIAARPQLDPVSDLFLILPSGNLT